MSFWQCELLNLRHRHCEWKKGIIILIWTFSVDICIIKTLGIVLLGLDHCCKLLHSCRTKEIISLFPTQMISLHPIIISKIWNKKNWNHKSISKNYCFNNLIVLWLQQFVIFKFPMYVLKLLKLIECSKLDLITVLSFSSMPETIRNFVVSQKNLFGAKLKTGNFEGENNGECIFSEISSIIPSFKHC